MTYSGIYAVIGIPVIGTLGALGVLVPPVVGRLWPKYRLTAKLYFSLFNGLAAGLILGVGLIHSIPDSIESITPWLDEETKTGAYPWPLFIALIGAAITFTLEELTNLLATWLGVMNFHAHGRRHQHDEDEEVEVLEDVESNNTNQQSTMTTPGGDEVKTKIDLRSSADTCKPSEECVVDVEDPQKKLAVIKKIEAANSAAEETEGAVRALAKMLVLFFGLFFHNVFVGMALGIADKDRALFIAIVFHQFFEGLALGAHIARTKLKKWIAILLVGAVFAFEVPIGIAIGLSAKASLEDGSKAYDIVDGTFQGLSGGILIYVALVHMIRAYEESGATKWRLEAHRFVSYFGFLLGIAVMAVIGIWG